MTIFSVLILTLWLVLRFFDSTVDSQLHVVACDVGQGDAILISRNDQQMLIDGGADSRVIDCLEQFMPFWDTTLEVVVATHPDADHITGLSNVLKAYKVPLIITNQQTKKTADFRRFQQAVFSEETTGGKHLFASQGQHFQLSKRTDISILNPRESVLPFSAWKSSETETLLSDVESPIVAAETDYNNQSVVMLVSYGNVDFLLTGDLEVAGEQALIKQGLINEVEVLKVGHHGAKTSSSPDLISKTMPEISLISVGQNNRFGHPNKEILERLEKVGSLIFRTDQLSTVELVSDGKKIWLAQPRFPFSRVANWIKVHCRLKFARPKQNTIE